MVIWDYGDFTLPYNYSNYSLLQILTFSFVGQSYLQFNESQYQRYSNQDVKIIIKGMYLIFENENKTDTE